MTDQSLKRRIMNFFLIKIRGRKWLSLFATTLGVPLLLFTTVLGIGGAAYPHASPPINFSGLNIQVNLSRSTLPCVVEDNIPLVSCLLTDTHRPEKRGNAS